MKRFLAITISMLLMPGVAGAIVTGLTCNTGQVCCYSNAMGGCMKCANSIDDCPVCQCPFNLGDDPTICSSTEWTANGTEGTYHRCLVDKVSTSALEICGCAYSCMAGYYMQYDVTGSKCVRCPSTNSVYGTTVDYNTSDITSCYIPTGTSLNDDTGTFNFTNECYYQN